MFRALDLFSGIGGFSLGLERTGGFKTIAFCEIDPYCRAVLRKHWPDVPCHEDIRKLQGNEFGPVDVICGGYPCQPFSLAGRRKGEEDDRHLWPELYRIVATVRPAWCVFENVAGHITMGLDQVLSDMERLGYACWPLVIPACAVNAPHRRDRVWIVSNHHSDGRRFKEVSQPKCSGQADFIDDGPQGAVAHAHSVRLQGRTATGCEQGSREKSINEQSSGLCGGNQSGGEGQNGWLPEPNVGRVAHGIPRRVDRIKALGNAVVPQVVTEIGNAILKAEGLK